MIKVCCDLCGRIIENKSELHFRIKDKKFRIAILEVRVQNGVRWKEADYCINCISKCLKLLVVDNIKIPEICKECIHNVNHATVFCRQGIDKLKKVKYCSFRKITPVKNRKK